MPSLLETIPPNFMIVAFGEGEEYNNCLSERTERVRSTIEYCNKSIYMAQTRNERASKFAETPYSSPPSDVDGIGIFQREKNKCTEQKTVHIFYSFPSPSRHAYARNLSPLRTFVLLSLEYSFPSERYFFVAVSRGFPHKSFWQFWCRFISVCAI